MNSKDPDTAYDEMRERSCEEAAAEGVTLNKPYEYLQWKCGEHPHQLRQRAKWKEIPLDQASLVVVECPRCGYHMGVDASYLEQIGPVESECPSCRASLDESTPCYVEEIE